MRDYGNIQSKFWTHKDIIHLSDQAKLLAAYLLSSYHTTMLGCFRIPIGYIAEDLNWDKPIAANALEELCDINLISYDKNNSWIFVHQFLKYNPVENPNQGKCIAKLFSHVPADTEFLPLLAEKLLTHHNFLPEFFYNHLLTLSKGFNNQEQKQYQNQKQEKDMSGKPDVYPQSFVFEKNKNQQPEIKLKDQAVEVLNFLNEKTNRAYRPVESNLKLIEARLKTGATVMDCRQIIAKKTRQWKKDLKMAEYLRPETLFNSIKFEQYLGEIVEPKEEAIHGVA